MSRAHDPERYWDRRLERTWDLQGVGLRRESRSYNAWLYRVRHHVFHRAVRDLPIDPRGARVVDVGAGVGFYVERWLRLGAHVVGVDIAGSAVRRLRERYSQARFEHLDVTADLTPLGSGYDVVTAFDVLFHVVDDDLHRRALANIHGLLRPGGWFVFTDVFARTRKQPMAHYVRRTAPEIEAVVRDAGFEVIARRPAFVVMNNPFDASPRVRRLWRATVRPLMRGELTGHLAGAVLYGPELLLTRLMKDSPSTELVICRRPS